MGPDRCPLCGATPVYVSFMGHDVECSNKECEAYSPELFPPLPLPPSMEDLPLIGSEDDEDETTDPMRKPVPYRDDEHPDYGD